MKSINVKESPMIISYLSVATSGNYLHFFIFSRMPEWILLFDIDRMNSQFWDHIMIHRHILWTLHLTFQVSITKVVEQSFWDTIAN